MKQKSKLLILFTSLVTVSIHMMNRLEYSHATSKNILACRDNHYYEWRFGKIRYRKKGQGAPLLLLHDLSLGSSSYEFSRLIDSLSKKHEVYALDFLGYGLSDKPNITFTNFLYVQMVTDFIQNVIGRKTDVIATGDSCPISIMTCHNNSNVFGKLILINPQSLTKLNQIPSKQTKILKLLIETPILGTFLYNILTSKATFKKCFTEEYFSKPYHIEEKDISSYYEASHLWDYNSKYAYASCLGRYININIIHALKQINHSIYIIGGLDKIDNKKIIDNYVFYNSAIKTSLIQGTKQLPHMEKPKAVLDQLTIFLN
mgnify:CR=1 FL=1